jgi:hypothetical protein
MGTSSNHEVIFQCPRQKATAKNIKTLDLLIYPIATVAFPYCDTKSATDEGDSTDWPTYIEKNWS